MLETEFGFAMASINDVAKLVENALQSGNDKLLNDLFNDLSKALPSTYLTGEEISAQVGIKTVYREFSTQRHTSRRQRGTVQKGGNGRIILL